MFLLLRSLVALAFAGGAASPLAQEAATRSEAVSIEASVDTGAAACEATPDEPVYSMAESPESSLALGFCVSDCSRCLRRQDCISPDFPNGAPCTPIALCAADGAPTD